MNHPKVSILVPQLRVVPLHQQEFNQTPSHHPLQFHLFSKNFPISIEGTIGSGKSSLLRHLQRVLGLKVKILAEPIEEWTNIEGVNLLQRYYYKPKKWGFIFQVQSMISMMKNHHHGAETKITERRIFSIKNVFLKAQELRNTLSPTEAKVLWDLYKQMLTTSVKHDLIVYLHLGPHLVLKRIKERGRLEERSIDFDYLKALHRLHDTWLNFSPSPRVIILDARLPTGLLIANLDAELGKIL